MARQFTIEIDIDKSVERRPNEEPEMPETIERSWPRMATIICTLSIIGVAGSVAPADAAKKKVTTKKSAVAKTAAPAQLPFDLARCTYVTDAEVSEVAGESMRLDTAQGENANAHYRGGAFEQCRFLSATGKGTILVHVQHSSPLAAAMYAEERAGSIGAGTGCPTGCVEIPGLGDQSFSALTYGVGGGAAGNAIVITRKATSHVVVFVPFGSAPAPGAAAQPDPVALDKAVRITGLVLRTA